MAWLPRNNHGDHCSCRLLAEAMGCDPRSMNFSYCQSVLMKRWAMDCNHGCTSAPPAALPTEKWHDLGPIDPVKAILITNE